MGTENKKLAYIMRVRKGQSRGWSEPLMEGEKRPVAYVVVKKE